MLSASLKNRINLTQTSKRQIKAVSRAIPLPPPAAQGRTGQGLLQQCGVSQAEPQQLPQPCAQRLVSGNAASGRALPYFTNIDTGISTSRTRNNISRGPLICRAALMKMGGFGFSSFAFLSTVATPQVDLSNPDPDSGTRKLWKEAQKCLLELQPPLCRPVGDVSQKCTDARRQQLSKRDLFRAPSMVPAGFLRKQQQSVKQNCTDCWEGVLRTSPLQPHLVSIWQ